MKDEDYIILDGYINKKETTKRQSNIMKDVYRFRRE